MSSSHEEPWNAMVLSTKGIFASRKSAAESARETETAVCEELMAGDNSDPLIQELLEQCRERCASLQDEIDRATAKIAQLDARLYENLSDREKQALDCVMACPGSVQRRCIDFPISLEAFCSQFSAGKASLGGALSDPLANALADKISLDLIREL